MKELGAQADKYLVFELAGSWFGIPTVTVKEILRPLPLTSVPRARKGILGIVSVRGQITTVFCLRTLLGFSSDHLQRESQRILLVDLSGEVVGMLVDAVHEVIRLHLADIESADSMEIGFSEHVIGIGRIGKKQKSVILIDPRPLLIKTVRGG